MVFAKIRVHRIVEIQTFDEQTPVAQRQAQILGDLEWRLHQIVAIVIEIAIIGIDGELTRGIGQLRRRKGSEEHTSELQSLMRISYAVFCLKKKKKKQRK